MLLKRLAPRSWLWNALWRSRTDAIHTSAYSLFLFLNRAQVHVNFSNNNTAVISFLVSFPKEACNM